jgi:phosphoribosylformylglycinamidine synthase subunit PurL
LKLFPTEGKHVILGPSEDSGIIAITNGPPGKRWGIVVSHESHNKPSQVVPFEGAATGVGGIVRDVLCMGARVVSLLDLLRFGDLMTDKTRTIAKEVVRGVGGYGNPIGVPNLGGDVEFDSLYNDQCLVNVVCHGIVREDEVIHSFVPKEAGDVGYDILVVGKPTDRSGFGGASFASSTLGHEKEEMNTGAVQEPNPFLERHLMDSTYALFDWIAENGHIGKVGFKDLGAGGVVCSSVEQVSALGLGAEIDLDTVHVAMEDLPPEVIACAETQERFCWMCHPDLTAHILKHYNEIWDLPGVSENARASVIGKVTSDGIYRLRFHDEVVCEAKAQDITCGFFYERPVIEPRRTLGEQTLKPSKPSDLLNLFHKILSHPNSCSRAPIFCHYDKNVLGNSIIEPGEGDAGVIAPLQNITSYVHEASHSDWEVSGEEKWTGVAIAADGKGRHGMISPYWQGANAAVEAMRNVAAVGALPRALTDCLNYGNPEKPEELWALSEGVRGIADAAMGVAIDGEPVPIISGNVSLYNGQIPPTAIVSCIGVMPDARKAVPMKVQGEGRTVYLLGERKDECGGSVYYNVLGELGANIPQPDFGEVKMQIEFVTGAIQAGLIESCHDISDGGLLMSLFEMLVPQRRTHAKYGLEVDLSVLNSQLPMEKLLFSETGGFVLVVEKRHTSSLQERARQHQLSLFDIGVTSNSPRFAIKDAMTADLQGLIETWQKPLEKALGL